MFFKLDIKYFGEVNVFILVKLYSIYYMIQSAESLVHLLLRIPGPQPTEAKGSVSIDINGL